MKNSVFVKFIAFVLCAASLVAIAGGGLGAACVEGYDLYNTTPAQEAERRLEIRALNLANYHARAYAQEAYTNLSQEEYSRLIGNDEAWYYYSGLDALQIRDEDGEEVHGINDPEPGVKGRTFTVTTEYPVALSKTTLPVYTEGYHGEYSSETTEPYENRMAVTVTDGVEVYESPDRNSELADILYADTRVPIYEEVIANGTGWCRIHTGWVELDYLAFVGQESTGPTEVPEDVVVPTEVPVTTEVPLTQSEEPAVPVPMMAEEFETATVIAHYLNVRPEPSPDGYVAAQLTRGDEVQIYERRTVDGATWGRIDQGWINLHYVAVGSFTEKFTLPAGLGEPLHYSEKQYTDGENEVTYQLAYYESPALEVTVWLDEANVLHDMQVINELYVWRDHFIPALLIGLVVFAMTFVYLCSTAGRTTAGEIRPSGLNRVPLDLYFVAAACVCVLCGAGIVFVIDRGSFDTNFFRTAIGLGGLGIALAVLGFCFCFAAQVKVKGHYWWHHSVTGWVVDWIIRLLAKGLLALRRVGHGACALFRMLPVVWQWLAVCIGLPFLAACFFFLTVAGYGFGTFLSFCLFLLCLVAFVGLVCYGAYCYGKLMKGVQNMARGDLNHKVPTQHLQGTFRDFAEKLNSLGSAAQIAAQRQMKSERMKTELITNVSHDIKTPLTSIINYVDLLKKPHTEKEGAQYLGVLDRQSQRLKKLIDDLMEMSKASTGNLSVELGQVDAVEAINQALGEFADKLAGVHLVPVFRHPEEPVVMRADGRLVWRVLSNVLSNAVKYALPDTRLYLDLMVLQGNAVIAIKNISRDQLNVDAEELMERFVRGDTSRNTEGSGLGLNIAKSLVELQQGQMHLMVDGDLFKVTLIFPLG